MCTRKHYNIIITLKVYIINNNYKKIKKKKKKPLNYLKKLKKMAIYNIIWMLEGDRYAIKEIRNTRF